MSYLEKLSHFMKTGEQDVMCPISTAICTYTKNYSLYCGHRLRNPGFLDGVGKIRYANGIFMLHWEDQG